MGAGGESIRRVLRFRSPGRCSRIGYPWTRVPEEAPPLDGLQLRLLPAADLFMALMLSRPGGLSLRTTWVTPATIGLAVAALGFIGLPGCVALALGLVRLNLLLAGGGLIGMMIAAGGGAVALYGIRQRLLR